MSVADELHEYVLDTGASTATGAAEATDGADAVWDLKSMTAIKGARRGLGRPQGIPQ